MKIEQDVLVEKKDSQNKRAKIILLLILFTILAVIGIFILILSIQGKSLTASINGNSVNYEPDTFIFTENNVIYISIKDIAGLVGYETHNGEYKVNVEDTSKMYVEAKDGTETTSFYLNSALIAKVAPNSTEDYEYIEIDLPVIKMNNKWYISQNGFMQAFNSIFSYSDETNSITIQTLPYLTEYYKQNIKNFGYDIISEEFNNQKALIYGRIIAAKSSTGKYGVLSTRTGEEIISPRYNDIKFIESSREFIITNASDKVGIAYETGETKIKVNYDEIKLIDSNLEYYLVKSNSKYGVINSEDELIVHIEYDSIGVDVSEFLADNIKNQYIFYNKLIPVCLNDKWGIFDVNGNKIAELEHDEVGCINSEITDRVVGNVLTIVDSEVIVLSKDGIYGGVNTKGDMILPFMFDYIYSLTSGGETKYYLVYKGIPYNASEFIERMEERLGYNNENNEENNNGEENNQTENNNQEDENGNTNQDNETNLSESNEDNNMSSALVTNENPEAKAFNSQFESYEGERSKNTILSFLDLIIKSNLESAHKIRVQYEENIYIYNISNVKESLVKDIYNVEIQYNEATQFIEKIVIK